MEIHWCRVCGRRATECHHIVFRSQQKALEHCRMNQVYLCAECHRGTKGVHGRDGHVLDMELKKELQDKLFEVLGTEDISQHDIEEKLGISQNASKRLLKALNCQKGKYSSKDVIRTCMGGKLI